MQKTIIRTGKAHPSRSMGPHVRQVIPSAVENLDPFVFLDHFGPFEKRPDSQGVPPHPHAGIATITYLFEGSNRHQDSYGHDAIIEAGDLAWMQAGKGIVHAEGMNEGKTKAERVHGLQLWISLPAKNKFDEPYFFHYPSADLPEFTIGQSKVKVLAGELHGHKSPVSSLSPAYIFELKLPDDTEIEIPLREGDTCGVYVINGNVAVDDIQIEAVHAARMSTAGDQLKIRSSTESHLIVLGGTPLNEPIYAYASFVMNSEDQIRQVMKDYQSGKMGSLSI